MSAKKILAAAALVVTAAGAVSALLVASASEAQNEDPGGNRRRAATAEVRRQDLVERESFEGTLGYADTRGLVANGQGTLTWLAEEGSTVRRGGVLYRVDGRAVRLLYGKTPAWRALAEGVEDGADVRQLEQNLVAMGYDPDGDIDVDEEFDWATAAAVKRWQEDMGVEEDGVIDLGEVVFLPGPRRVGAHKVELGSVLTPGTEVMDTSSTRRVVTLDLEADQQALVDEGDRVRVELHDGTTVRGTVSKVGKVAESESSEDETGEDSGGTESDSEPTIEVIITLSIGARTGGVDQAPVDVEIAKRTEKNVLAVPVTALLALAEGGFAVEVQQGRSTRLVAVKVGMYADGWVQVSGEGIREGMKVVVAE